MLCGGNASHADSVCFLFFSFFSQGLFAHASGSRVKTRFHDSPRRVRTASSKVETNDGVCICICIWKHRQHTHTRTVCPKLKGFQEIYGRRVRTAPLSKDKNRRTLGKKASPHARTNGSPTTGVQTAAFYECGIHRPKILNPNEQAKK